MSPSLSLEVRLSCLRAQLAALYSRPGLSLSAISAIAREIALTEALLAKYRRQKDYLNVCH